MSLPAHVLLSIVFAVASSVNHIDDTDETHGYYEPVHYLLYGTGLQTWEYSPEFALRSYAFLTPFVAAGTALHALGFSKLQVFYGIRIILSQFMAYAVASLTHESKKVFGPEKCGYFVATLIFCPGLFFCSSAFLPSAVCCGLAALAMSSLMSGHHGYTILYGCLAVLWTGWPFIGLIFLPMGYTILHREIEKGSFNNVFRIAALGIIHVASISVAVLLLDSYYYGRRTFPPLNILMYNALSGNGDELYGIEPASYYIKNLLLTLGLTFPMALLEIIIFTYEIAMSVLGFHQICAAWLYELTTILCVVLWMGTLFSRPHKEERFMYPIYPLMCLLSALTLHRLENICGALLKSIMPPTAENTLAEKMIKSKTSAADKSTGLSRRIVYVGICSLLGVLAASRITVLYHNFSGYIELWKQVADVAHEHMSSTGVLRDKKLPGAEPSAIICIGADWYTFPSHFFMPPILQLEYFQDDFHGILPQHFSSSDGTSAKPALPFNDKNREEMAFYKTISSCDYIVRTMREGDRQEQRHRDYFNGYKMKEFKQAFVIDSANSPLLTRAVYIPMADKMLGLKNAYSNYSLFYGTSILSSLHHNLEPLPP